MGQQLTETAEGRRVDAPGAPAALPAEPAAAARGSAGLATALCLLPGLGQLYNREPRKAAFFLSATLLTIGPSILLLMAAERLGHDLLRGHAFTAFLLLGFLSIIGFILLFIFGLGLWVSSAVDARRTALGERGSRGGRWWFMRL